MGKRASNAATIALAAVASALGACGGGSSHGTRTSTAHSPGSAPASSQPTQTVTAPTSTRWTTSGPNTVTASLAGLVATLRARTHTPIVQRAWPITFTVTRGGRPEHASVSYEYLFGEQVVARRSHYVFYGHFSDVFHWPASAAGYPLTFRAVVSAAGTMFDLDYPVQVAR